MAYQAKLVKGKTYNLQGIQFKNGEDAKAVPDHLVNYLKHNEMFEVTNVDDTPNTLEEMDADELQTYAEMNNIDVGRATSKETLLERIKKAEQGGQEDNTQEDNADEEDKEEDTQE